MSGLATAFSVSPQAARPSKTTPEPSFMLTYGPAIHPFAATSGASYLAISAPRSNCANAPTMMSGPTIERVPR